MIASTDADTLDWERCIICGEDGDLRCPADRPDGEGGALLSYDDFLQNVDGFRQLHSLPVEVNDKELDSANTLLQHRAKWHKSCRLKFARSKLERTRERQMKKRKTDNCEHVGRRSKRQHSEGFIKCCIFCRTIHGNETLHNCSTMELDKSIREMATQLQDIDMLTLMAEGDLVAIGAKYHLRCLVAFRNRYRSLGRDSQKDPCNGDIILQLRVFAELVSYIENEIEDGSYIFKLSEIHTLYEDRLSVLGLQTSVNKSRLKTQILLHFASDCQEQSDGRNTLLVFTEGLQRNLKSAVTARDFDDEALSMSRVVKSVRCDMSAHDGFEFSGSFPTHCQERSVPVSLKSLVSMLLYGNNITDKNDGYSQACLTICQLIVFNSKQPTPTSSKPRHIKKREPPLPVYLGLNVHNLTRSKKMITRLYELGMSVSYERTLEVEDRLTTALCKRFVAEDAVCPPQMRKGIFTVGALDNIDHNLSSTTAQGSFHGTSISLFQFPTIANPGIIRPPVALQADNSPAPPLPDSYRIVPDVACNIKSVTVPTVYIPNTVNGHLETAGSEEMKWTQCSTRLLSHESLTKGENITWAAFHAANQAQSNDPAGISALLPLFFEKAATIPMVRHGMTIMRKATEKLNPGQIPVMAVDQPLFALSKYVQWTWPEAFGESSFVIMLGGLHVEMALWKMVGDLLQGSGWTTALHDASVASAGTADSFLHASHLTRTRHAHQVSVLSLTKLQRDGWHNAKCQQNENPEDAIVEWRKEMCASSPTFAYWDMVMRLELLVLIFVRSHRERNFALYIEALEALVPWFFALDHHNYARWVPVHIRDMKTIPSGIREQLQQFWIFRKTLHQFSAMPLDQAHEQNNAKVKEAGGAIGLTENPIALKRWMVSGPEQARLLAEFETQYHADHKVDTKCHEEGTSRQNSFKNEVNKLCVTIASMGNPFDDTSHELMALDSHNCTSKEVVATLLSMEATGNMRYAAFVKDVLVDRTVSIHEPIKKNGFHIFKHAVPKCKSRAKLQIEEVQSDCNLFSQLFVASQVRDGNLGEFFRHENHPWPPSLSLHGKLRLPNCKSKLLDLLPTSVSEDPDHFDVKVFDGPAIVHTLPRGGSSTFGEYSSKIFLPWTIRQLQDCKRIDVVWDVYYEESLKEATREKRGNGVRRRVSPETKMPVNFQTFLHNSSNKEELFALLSDTVSAFAYPPGKEIYITSGQSVVSKTELQKMLPSNHEEADTRMCLHVADAVHKGATNVMVSTVDTDVVVILVGTFCQLKKMRPDVQLWVAFGNGKHYKRYHINSICEQLGEDKCVALPFFHAFTGCDTTSQFNGKGKKSCWEAWDAFPFVTKGFAFPMKNPFVPLTTESPFFELIEAFTCVLYDRSTTCEEVNDLRKDLFPRKVQRMQHLPPTQAALLQHVNRSMFQSSIWLRSFETQQNVSCPEVFGWTKKDTKWEPQWTTLDEAATSCRQLIKCGCKSEPLCSKRCVCKSTGLRCTALCRCLGNCTQC